MVPVGDSLTLRRERGVLECSLTETWEMDKASWFDPLSLDRLTTITQDPSPQDHGRRGLIGGKENVVDGSDFGLTLVQESAKRTNERVK